MKENNSLLSIKNLRTHFYSSKGITRAVDGVSFSVDTHGQARGTLPFGPFRISHNLSKGIEDLVKGFKKFSSHFSGFKKLAS